MSRYHSVFLYARNAREPLFSSKLTAVIFASLVVFAALVAGCIMICISKATRRTVIRPTKLVKPIFPLNSGASGEISANGQFAFLLQTLWAVIGNFASRSLQLLFSKNIWEAFKMNHRTWGILERERQNNMKLLFLEYRASFHDCMR